jgi:hypothetical protein
MMKSRHCGTNVVRQNVSYPNVFSSNVCHLMSGVQVPVIQMPGIQMPFIQISVVLMLEDLMFDPIVYYANVCLAKCL